MDIFDFNIKLRTETFLTVCGVLPEPTPAMETYIKLYKGQERSSPEPIEKTIDRMKEHGITQATIRSDAAEYNELVLEISKKYPLPEHKMYKIDHAHQEKAFDV